MKFIRLLNHRDFVIGLAIVFGLIFGDKARMLSDISVYTLSLVMVVATSGFSFRSWLPLKNALIPFATSIFLNYFIFSLIIIGLSWLFMPNQALFTGFVLIAAAPPGPSVIPFSASLKGDINFSLTGVFGAHLAAMALTPLLLFLVLGNSVVEPGKIFIMMLKLIVFPLIISRFLRYKKLLPVVEKYRGAVINWGFFLVIMPIIGLSKYAFFTHPQILFLVSLVCLLSMFGLGFLYAWLMFKIRKNKAFVVSTTLMLVTKSSAFSAVTAINFFGKEASIPSAILSVFVTLFIMVFDPWIKKMYKGYQ